MSEQIKTLTDLRKSVYKIEVLLINGEIDSEESESLKLFVYDEYNRMIRKKNKTE